MPSRHEDSQSRLSAQVRAGAQHLDVSWTPERAERIRVGILRRQQVVQRRRKVLRVAGMVSLVLLTLWLPRVTGLWPTVGSRGKSGESVERAAILSSAQPAAPKSAPQALPPVEAPPSSLHLADGSSARPRASSAVAVREEGTSRVVVELLQGGAEFAVAPSSQRLFRVAAGGAAVESSGAHFSIDKQRMGEAEGRSLRVTVAVSEGRVRVFWAGQQAVLVAGERVEFQVSERSADFVPAQSLARSPLATMAPPPRAQPSPRSGLAVTPQRLSTSSSPTVSWRQLARAGDFERAYQQAFAAARTGSTPPTSQPLGQVVLSDVVPASPEPADLLLLADVARMSHHPASAVAPLRRLLDRHREDPRAPLAAFTLGRVLLDDMGQAREAAESFRQTQDLDAEGPLSHDALAREVEAWSRAGDLARARERAREYIHRYPSGRRLSAVRRMAELPTTSPTAASDGTAQTE
jgi:transmembrane sensor